ncbi:MAG: oligosaccharide flippase family protein [Acidobacteria bacterium]|nr:oligosaccharide flippase family protein [Acidobacteriota bacterium]
MSENRVGSVPVTAAASTQSPDIVKLAARGTIYITIAKAYFMVTGLATYLILPRVISVAEFGLYSITAGVASIINAVVMTGTLQAVSKFVSQDTTQAEAVKRKALQLQLLVGGGIAGGFFLLAPVIARHLNDPGLTPYFRLTAFISFTYSVYAVFLGTINGRREFFKQALLDISYSTFKMIFVVGLALAGYAVMGALSGWLLASLCVLFLSVMVVGWREKVGDVGVRDLLSFQSMALIFILILNLLQKIDLLLVKALSSPDPKVASHMAGYYNAVMTIANITFQSIIALTFVVFPLISESTFKADREATKRYISQTLRFSLMIMVMLATLFSSNAAGLLGLIYKQEYLAGTSALMIAPFGMLLFGLLYIATTIISSSGRPHVSVFIGVFTLLADASFNSLLIPRYKLLGAAVATTAAMFWGVGIGLVYILRQFSASLPLRSAVRIVLAGLMVFFISRPLSATGLVVLLKLAFQAIAYGGILLLLREIGADDIRVVRRMFVTRQRMKSSNG